MELDAVYGSSAHDRRAIEVPMELAELFAVAHRRVTRRPAGWTSADGRLVVPGLASPAEVVGAPVQDVVRALDAAERPVILAGPGVIDEGRVGDLRRLAATGCLGVLNTWGAKGLFEWTSPHHLATAGLQARDFELGGLGDADLILATGVDPAEALVDWRLAPVIEVAPSDLSAVAARWRRPAHEIAVPPLRTELARVTQEGWAADDAPIPPTRATLTYSEVLGADGLVVADPGTAGYWVARTFPTTRLGGAIVPAEADRPGLGATCAVVSRLFEPHRPVLVVIDGTGPFGAAKASTDGARSTVAGRAPRSAVEVPVVGTRTSAEGTKPASRVAGMVDGTTAAVLEVANDLAVTVAVEVWTDDGDALSAGEHRDRLRRLVERGGVGALATDPSQLDRMIDVAGPVVAWGGLAVAGVAMGGPVGEAG